CMNTQIFKVLDNINHSTFLTIVVLLFQEIYAAMWASTTSTFLMSLEIPVLIFFFLFFEKDYNIGVNLFSEMMHNNLLSKVHGVISRRWKHDYSWSLYPLIPKILHLCAQCTCIQGAYMSIQIRVGKENATF
ncbi:hypothetical protein ACJX0J_024602, partial [Zea mays]